MKENFITSIVSTWSNSISEYFKLLQEYPIKLVSLILDLAIVIFIVVKMFQIAKGSRALQLIKGIILFILITWLSGILNLTIVHSVLTAFLPSGVIALVVIFQPEIRRGLEQIGTNKFTNLFGMDKSIETKTREDIYKIVIAVEELAKTKTGALIVIQRDISLSDIISTGIEMNSEISPQLLVNIFVPKTPLHDGAVVINNNRIAAAACILPLANNTDISKELGTRHRAAVGISKEYDAIAIVVSEESGKISIAKDGTLIVDVKEDALKKILIKNIITNRLDEKEKNKLARLKNIQELKKKDKEEQVQYRLPFGGGSGAGVTINPIAFIVISQNNVKLLPVNHSSSIDKILDYIPDLIEKTNNIMNRCISNKKQETQEILKQMKQNTKQQERIEKKQEKQTENIENTMKKIEQDKKKNNSNKSNTEYEFEYDDTNFDNDEFEDYEDE